MDMLLTFWSLCLLSPVIYWGLRRGGRRLRVRCRTRRRWVADPGPPPRLTRDRPPLERLVADLHRLEEDFRRIERTNPPAKMLRLQAVSLAYDDVLCECCLALGLPEPADRPLRGVDRLQAECELARHGLTW